MFASKYSSIILIVLLISFGSRANAAVKSIYLGGTGDDVIAAIAEDSSGNFYVTGYTYSTDFQGTTGGAQSHSGGALDCFIAKLSPDLTLLQATYLGGSGADRCTGIALDSLRNVIVTGLTTSTDFPNTAGGVQPSSALCTGVCYDAFVAKFNSSLTTLSQATYLGGSKVDQAFGLAIDLYDNIYVAGITNSPDFPSRAGGAQSSLSGAQDGFIAKLNSALTNISQATYFGGNTPGDMINTSAMTLDAGGNVFITGYAYASSLPGIAGGAQTVNTGAGNYMAEAFVARFNSTLTSVLQSTFYGGSGDDMATAMDLDSSGNVYVTGYTNSTDLPNVANGAQTTKAGGSNTNDAFVVKFNPELTTILQATYLGGSGNDRGNGMIINLSTGDVFVAGSTNSTDFPKTAGGIQETNAGGYDGFVSKLTPDLKTITQSTYFGGTNDDGFNAILWVEGAAADTAGADNIPNQETGGSVVGSGGSNSNPNSLSSESSWMSKITDMLIPPGTPVGFPDIAVCPEGSDINIAKLPKKLQVVDFGKVEVTLLGGVEIFNFIVKNQGTGKLTLRLIMLENDNPLYGSFTFYISSCLVWGTLDPSNSCSLNVQATMQPMAVAKITGTLTITSDDPDTPIIDIKLKAEGVAPSISVRPSKLGLGKGIVWETTTPKPVTVENKGGASLKFGEIKITGPNASEFSYTDTCGYGTGLTTSTDFPKTTSELPPGSKCYVWVTLTPETVGPKTGILNITTNDLKKSEVKVKLSGTGMARKCKLIKCGEDPGEYVGNRKYCCKTDEKGNPTGICRLVGTTVFCADE